MNQEQSHYIITTYPSIFTDSQSIDCGDGWYNLIDIMCLIIQGYLDRMATVESDALQFGISSICSNTTTWSVTYSGGDQYIASVIAFAQMMSGRVCVTTGNVQTLRNE